MTISNPKPQISNLKHNLRGGQTLVFLLVFMAIAIVITSAAVIVTTVNTTASSQLGIGNTALDIATSGAENGLLRLLRDPNYAGETLTVGSGSATISVAGGVITSVGRIASFSRTVQVTISYASNVLTILSWKEKF